MTGTHFVRVCRAMFWTSVPWLRETLRRRFGQLLRQRQPTTVKTLRRHGNKDCYASRCGVTCHCCCGSLEADCCGSGNYRLLPSRSQSLHSRRAHSNVRHDTGPLCTCRVPFSFCKVHGCSYQRVESSHTVHIPVVHDRGAHRPSPSGMGGLRRSWKHVNVCPRATLVSRSLSRSAARQNCRTISVSAARQCCRPSSLTQKSTSQLFFRDCYPQGKPFRTL